MRRALIVDDKEENLYYLKALLSGHGYAVETARQGVEALALARQTPPDIVISDLLMPMMDGYTLLRQWKTDPALQRIPFIVYTATYTSAEDERLVLDLGADAFIVKPAEPEDFMARIRLVETGASSAGAAAPREAAQDQSALLQQYSAVVVRKLEQKIAELEATRRALEHEIAVRKDMGEIQRGILDALPALVGLIDATGIILAVNEAWRQSPLANGLQDPRLGLGVNYLSACEKVAGDSARDAQEAARGIRRVLAGEVPSFAMEYPCHSPTEPRWFQLTVTPLRRNGGAGGAVVMHLDITERRTLEEQLVRSQKMEAIGQLTGGVAHDFNNLLGVISGNLELLDEQLQDRPELSEMAQIALRATGRGAALTRSLLAFARQQPLDPRPTDANVMVREMTELLRRTVPETIKLEFTPKATWQCEVDPGQLQNAVLNLVLNARDAMPEGGQLTIETGNRTLDSAYAATHVEVAPGDYVVLAVSDTGIGMERDVIAQAFDPFFTTKEVGKGTGLGLSMVYGFAKQSLGHVSIYSEPGHGTTVRLYLPRSATVAPATGDAAKSAAPPLGGKGEMILVVEDDEHMRALTSELLHSLGYEVIAAAEAKTALGLLRENRRIAVLLTDMILPGAINGRELAEAALGFRPDLKVVYMSGYTENAVIRHGRLDPGVQLLEKPFSKRSLAAKIRAVLDRESA